MAYPASLWTKIKTDYEKGDYSQEQLSKKYSIPRVTIDKKCVTEKWQKGSLIHLAEKTQQQKFIDAFVKRGFTEEKVVEIIDKMSAATKPTIIKGFGEERESVDGEKGEAQGFVAEIEDWQARDKAITQYAKLTGSYAVSSIPMVGNQTILIKIDI